jgi:hypothetical protein
MPLCISTGDVRKACERRLQRLVAIVHYHNTTVMLWKLGSARGVIKEIGRRIKQQLGLALLASPLSGL